mmetsp:Transcript_79336/g.222475  ORF Transcript_79336/g.222475 Transcript_79336/m.222475 type:complete len:718 (+) Transcript_79336:965-3118(+)
MAARGHGLQPFVEVSELHRNPPYDGLRLTRCAEEKKRERKREREREKQNNAEDLARSKICFAPASDADDAAPVVVDDGTRDWRRAAGVADNGSRSWRGGPGAVDRRRVGAEEIRQLPRVHAALVARGGVGARFEQRLHLRLVVEHDRNHQRRGPHGMVPDLGEQVVAPHAARQADRGEEHPEEAAEPGADALLEVRPSLDQDPRHLRAPGEGARVVEGREAAVLPGARPMRQQQLHRGALSEADGRLQRRGADLGPVLKSAPPLQQQLHRGAEAPRRGVDERGLAEAVHRADAAAPLDEQLDGLEVAALRGDVQRLLPRLDEEPHAVRRPLAARVRAALEERLDDARVAQAGGDEEQRGQRPRLNLHHLHVEEPHEAGDDHARGGALAPQRRDRRGDLAAQRRIRHGGRPGEHVLPRDAEACGQHRAPGQHLPVVVQRARLHHGLHLPRDQPLHEPGHRLSVRFDGELPHAHGLQQVLVGAHLEDDVRALHQQRRRLPEGELPREPLEAAPSAGLPRAVVHQVARLVPYHGGEHQEYVARRHVARQGPHSLCQVGHGLAMVAGALLLGHREVVQPHRPRPRRTQLLRGGGGAVPIDGGAVNVRVDAQGARSCALEHALQDTQLEEGGVRPPQAAPLVAHEGGDQPIDRVEVDQLATRPQHLMGMRHIHGEEGRYRHDVHGKEAGSFLSPVDGRRHNLGAPATAMTLLHAHGTQRSQR